MTIEIRRTTEAEARTTSEVVSNALLFPRLTDEEWEVRGATWNETDSISAWDGDRCVGHVGAFRFDTTVPGGARLATAAVTRVGVLPTHTRKGLLTKMMTQLLTEGRAAGQALASLRASEAVIYQRYGFEVGGEALGVTVTSARVRPLRSASAGSVRILAAGEILDVIPELYERCGRIRPGTVSRSAFFWQRIVGDAIKAEKPSFVVVHAAEDGTLDGYAHYEVRWQERPDGFEVGVGEIHELFGVDGDVELALWAFLTDIDLIVEWTAENRPVDEGVRFAARDPRGYRVTQRWDEQWVRILDVDAALTARAYAEAVGSVTIRVEDPLFDANTGTWRIDARGAARTDDAPDLTVSIGILSAAYLGGTSWHELHSAGHVQADPATAATSITTADALFTVRPKPFCGTFF